MTTRTLLRSHGLWINHLAASAAFAGLALGVALAATQQAEAAPTVLPTGAQTVSGASSVSQSGTTLTVTQTSAKAAINWQSFNIAQGHTVNFVQPSASAVSLNRVVGTDVSVIQGVLNANGHVFLLNPNGVLFTSSAQVNVGGIVASTLHMKTEDFMAGRYTFEGAGSSTVVNQGNITAAKGGFVGLIAAKVLNTGKIVAPEGSVVAAAGNRVTLDLGGPIKIKVEEGVLDALVEQGGAIRADGGMVYLTAKAVGAVTRTVINHTGITEARTLSTGKDGKIYMMGGMEKDRISVAGKLDASAPNGGNGGLVETSAAHVQIAKDAQVTTLAPKGKTGTWLIDPVDFSISEGDFAQTSNFIGATTLGNLLNSTSVTIQTDASTDGNGDISLLATVTKTAGATTTLTLAAHRDILLTGDSGIFGSPGSPLNIVLSAGATGSADGRISIGINSLVSFGGDITLGGGDLQASDYAKGRDGEAGINMFYNTIDATETGESQRTSGAAGFTSQMPTSSGGGNIVIAGRGGTGGGPVPNRNGGIRMDGTRIVTGGAGSITLKGIGGQQRDQSRSDAGININGSHIKAKDGTISLDGRGGTGFNRYGVSVGSSQGFDRNSGYFFVESLIGTNGSVRIEGDSLALMSGGLQIFSGQASSLRLPVVCIFGGNTLTKSGLGVLTFAGNAKDWVPPPDTLPTLNSGSFVDENNNSVFDGVTKIQALYAFGARDPIPVYLRLREGSGSHYGDPFRLDYGLYDAPSGGQLIWNAYDFASGTALWTGGPTATNRNVGVYSMTYTGGVTLRGDTYTLNIGSASIYTIFPRSIRLLLDPKSKVAGSPDPALTYSLLRRTPLVEGESLFGSLSRTPGETPGRYIISAAGLINEPRNSNYRIMAENSAFTITEPPIAIAPATARPEIRSTLNSVYVIPPVVPRPTSAQLNVGLQLVPVAAPAATRSRQNSAPAALSVDPVAAATRAPGTVLVLTGGVKRAAEDKGGNSENQKNPKR